MISTNKKNVCFTLPPTIIYESLDMVDVLKEYRRNNEIQKKVDKERIARILSPILLPEHRSKILKQNSYIHI
jgi:hypothetical protein